MRPVYHFYGLASLLLLDTVVVDCMITTLTLASLDIFPLDASITRIYHRAVEHFTLQAHNVIIIKDQSRCFRQALSATAPLAVTLALDLLPRTA